MKIQIIDLIPDHNELNVSFHSANGDGIALWKGATPEVGEVLDVEFDLDDIFSWGKNITPSSASTSKIENKNGVTFITAQLIQRAGDECAALKLGSSIILIELEVPIVYGSNFVEVRINRIYLYPTNT